MPRYGCINERRNQLHEVIRLSGMNLIIDDTDHPLIIKVASIQSARMQVYFIDNEDYFQRKYVLTDKNNVFFKDNDERAVFYCRGVLETVKKLSWAPDIIHCHGWMTSLIPLYIKKAFKDNPLFTDSKVVYSIYDDGFSETFSKNFANKIKIGGIRDSDLAYYKNPNFFNITKAAIDLSDGIIIGSKNINPKVSQYLQEIDKPVLGYDQSMNDNYIDIYSEFYDDVLCEELVMSK